MLKLGIDRGVCRAGLVSALILVVTTFPGVTVAGDAESQDAVAPRARGRDAQDVVAFLGLWEGVDPLDGSKVQVSLSDVDGDGTIELAQNESFFTVCLENGPDFSQGRGVITLRSHDSVLLLPEFDDAPAVALHRIAP